MPVTRRTFVRGTLAAGAAGLAVTSPLRRAVAANEQIRVAVLGVRMNGGRGETHIDWVQGVEGMSVVAICDPDSQTLAGRAAWIEKNYNKKVDQAADFRQLLDRQDIDVISIASPNHWHSLMAIWAMQAGKDVYCEKPVSHNVWEGRQVVLAARKYNKICATGTQIRSATGVKDAVEFVRSGQIGRIQYAIATCYKPRKSIGKLDAPLAIPDAIDYDLWCGPAAKVDLFRPQLHYDWHWDYNTGNGDLGNQGIHQMDIARWFLGESALSPRVWSVGGRFAYEDAGNTANTQVVFHDYPAAPLIFEVRGLPRIKSLQEGRAWDRGMDSYRGSGGIGVVIQCEGGYVVVNSYSGGKAFDNDGKQIKPFNGGGDHMRNFADAVRDRNYMTLNADIEEGHISSGLCHTGNISYRLGAKKSAAEVMEEIQGNHNASESFGRMAVHLAANGIDISQSNLQAGPWLEMDPKAERFTNDDKAVADKANALLTREYRAPFVVPDIARI